MFNFMKNPKVKREYKTHVEHLNEYKESLNKIFVFWPRDVMSHIEIVQDMEFLLNMMGPRTSSFGGKDKKLATTKSR